jgi:hypothetical protein
MRKLKSKVEMHTLVDDASNFYEGIWNRTWS